MEEEEIPLLFFVERMGTIIKITVNRTSQTKTLMGLFTPLVFLKSSCCVH